MAHLSCGNRPLRGVPINRGAGDGKAETAHPIISMIRFGVVCEYPLRNVQGLASDLYSALSFPRIAASRPVSYQLAPALRRSVLDSTRAGLAAPETAAA